MKYQTFNTIMKAMKTSAWQKRALHLIIYIIIIFFFVYIKAIAHIFYYAIHARLHVLLTKKNATDELVITASNYFFASLSLKFSLLLSPKTSRISGQQTTEI